MGSVKIKWMISNPIPFRRAQPQNLDQSFMNVVQQFSILVSYFSFLGPI